MAKKCASWSTELEIYRQLASTRTSCVANSCSPWAILSPILPRVITPAEGQVTAFRLSNDGRDVFAGLNNGRLVVYDDRYRQSGAELKRSAGG